MSESGTSGGETPAVPIVRIAQEIPVIFVDGVSSQSYAFGVTKLYFSRFDPDPAAVGGSKETHVMQIVMPTENFVSTFAFLEHRLKNMIETGAVKEDQLEAARNYWRSHQGTETA
jgi:hypothetical protein